MEITLKRNDEPQKVTNVVLTIGTTTYRLSESVDGNLNINKTTDENDERLYINPRSGNEIELS